MIEMEIPAIATLRLVERSPHIPRPKPSKLLAAPQIGSKAAHRLIMPNATENKAQYLLDRSSGSNSV